MYRHSVICAYGIFIPDIFIDLIDRENFSLVFHQKQQNIVFDRCQFHDLAVYGDFLSLIIDGKTTDLINRLPVFRSVSKLCVAAQL